ncbi:hypothetical protein D9611_009281 [Ephemerocybe angulata]|uniref:Uncharacterized protein n=1 Tax=Ephemerocybe angulata TaxID=980116 RepID=A0A8H5F484_9AGAR|nr:hypothetical protein D9611_009281 [Tulosesus angulatus]
MSFIPSNIQPHPDFQMATTAPMDPHLAVERFLRDGPTVDEKAAFVDAALKYLLQKAVEDAAKDTSGPVPVMFMTTNLFAASQAQPSNTTDSQISETAAMATTVKTVFDQINDMYYSDVCTTWAGSRGDYWPYFGYRSEWTLFGTRWGQGLATSYYLAEKNVDILYRFNAIYLAKVENIATEQDRLDAIAALTQFLDDNPDRSDEMAQTFLNLKRDIAAFITTFSNWIATLGINPSMAANGYKASIEVTGKGIQEQVLSLASEYRQTLTCHHSGRTGCLVCVCHLLSEMKRSLKSLQDGLLALHEPPPLDLMDKLASWNPDLQQMFDRMITIGEVWTSVRSQAVQFRAHIQGGLGAATNMRFKNEVKLARAVCGPLRDSLQKYMRGLYLYWNPE